MNLDTSPRLIFTCGDLNGIGIETFFGLQRDEAYVSLMRTEGFTSTLVAPPDALARYAESTGVALESVSSESRAPGPPMVRCVGSEVTFELLSLEQSCTLNLGTESADAGEVAFRSIVEGVELVKSSPSAALVTLPISKHAMSLAGHDFPGHTELLAHLTGSGPPLMILMSRTMKVALATAHLPLSQVSRSITGELVGRLIDRFVSTLTGDFGIDDPRVAVLGLNPHAGERGMLGTEERDVISPTIAERQSRHPGVRGPFPADAFFARYDSRGWDGVLAMYHDQGLIPLKMSAAGAGVNFTAGLSMVRTSPDHGTAFDIAGKGTSDHRSLIEACRVALEVLNARSQG